MIIVEVNINLRLEVSSEEEAELIGRQAVADATNGIMAGNVAGNVTGFTVDRHVVGYRASKAELDADTADKQSTH